MWFLLWHRLLNKIADLGPLLAGQIAMAIFLAVFAGVLIWVFARSRQEINHWSRIPLEEGKSEQQD